MWLRYLQAKLVRSLQMVSNVTVRTAASWDAIICHSQLLFKGVLVTPLRDIFLEPQRLCVVNLHTYIEKER